MERRIYVINKWQYIKGLSVSACVRAANNIAYISFAIYEYLECDFISFDFDFYALINYNGYLKIHHSEHLKSVD